ncbi:hypothetical protein OAJ57_00790 [Alphaproteobacteria bacterium]|nr:hypothetical protein [Alphaproteobacteria bacterium]
MTGWQAYDLAIICGGINGAGIARNAAGRGLSVVLFEAGLHFEPVNPEKVAAMIEVLL